MSVTEILQIICDQCGAPGPFRRSHEELQRDSVSYGWYRDAWVDRCPACSAKMSARSVPDAQKTTTPVEYGDGEDARIHPSDTPTPCGKAGQ